MSHFGDFMDGVPVKISEKYKRPPKVELPHSVIECPIRAQNVLDNVKYCFDFDRNVLSKLNELRSIKETKKNERRHRLQLLEEAKQKKLDDIAVAEEQERLKQLSVSEVSYPSTEEISALSQDDKIDKNTDETVEKCHESVHENIDVNVTSHINEPHLNILQPIQVKSNYEGSLLDDPDPLQTLKINTKPNRIHYNRNVETLTFRDFENDTSSPFDNVELKTINDMELLAQVLQSQRESATSCHPQQYNQATGYVIPNCASQAQMEMAYAPNTYTEQPIQGPSLMYAPQNYPNGYYIPDNDNVNVYIPNYQYYVPTNPYNLEQGYYGSQFPTSAEVSQVSNGSQYVQQPYYYQYQPVEYQPEKPDSQTYVQNEVEKADNQTCLQNEAENQSVSSQNNVKSKSRSSTDIVKELNEELEKLKMKATTEAIPAPTIAEPSPSEVKKVEKRRRKTENLPNPYNSLPQTGQDMCKMIHGMGFPLERVARVCKLVGENHKKVIECLLIIGEMMDLGFSEKKVLLALANNGFNRDKALDELVS